MLGGLDLVLPFQKMSMEGWVGLVVLRRFFFFLSFQSLSS
jgi:hypothetical protein